MGKDSGGDSQTQYSRQEVVPWSGVQGALTNAFSDYGNLYKTGGPQYYPGQTYVTPDPLQNYAQNLNLGYAMQSMPQQVGEARAAQTSMLNAPDVANNPYIGGIADVIQKRMGRQFTEQTMPRIEGGAVAAGQKGGSREALAGRLAARDLSEATGDALAGLYADAYGQGLTQQARGMAYAPQTMQMGLAPMQVMSGVGDYRQNIANQYLQADRSRYDYGQELPFANLDRYLSALNMAPWGSSTVGEREMPGASPLAGAVGGGMLGYGAYAPVASALTAAGPPGALASGLLGLGPLGFAAGGALLGGLFS